MMMPVTENKTEKTEYRNKNISSNHIILRAAPSELRRTLVKIVPAVTDEVWLRGTIEIMSEELGESRRANNVVAALLDFY